MIEEVRKWQTCSFALTRKKAMRLTSSPLFKSAKIINEEFVICFMRRKQLHLNKPIYAGFMILENAKAIMYGGFDDIRRYGTKS